MIGDRPGSFKRVDPSPFSVSFMDEITMMNENEEGGGWWGYPWNLLS
jgi:hypothetical protein